MPGSRRLHPDPSSFVAIGRRLRITRKALNLSQADVSRLSGVGRNTYNQWENEVGRPNLDGALALCNSLNLTLDWIFRGVSAGLPSDLLTKIAAQPKDEDAAA